jgi:hypothetical protein
MKKCLFLNLSNPKLEDLDYYIKHQYIIYCVNLSSIIFCKENNINFYYLDNLASKQDKKKILENSKKLWEFLFKKKKNKIDTILDRILSHDYYSLHYFFISYFSGKYLARNTHILKFDQIIYLGESFEKISLFSAHSIHQDKVFLHEFFKNLKDKKIIIKIKDNKSHTNFSNKYFFFRKLFFNVLIFFIFLISDSLNKFQKKFFLKKNIIFINARELYRFKSLKKKYSIFFIGSKIRLEKITKLKNILDSSVLNLNNNKSKIFYKKNLFDELYINFKKKCVNLKNNLNINYRIFFKEYFYNRLPLLLKQYHSIRDEFSNIDLENIICSNLSDVESYIPILALENKVKNVFLIQHSTFYPTINYNNKTTLYVSDSLQKFLQPKDLKIKYTKKYVFDEYPFNLNSTFKIKKKKTNVLILSQSFPPSEDVNSFFMPKSFFFKKLDWLENFFKEKCIFNVYLKMHPAMEQNYQLCNYIEKNFKQIKLLKNFSYKNLSSNFNNFILMEFPVKIALNLLKNKKNISFLSFHEVEKFFIYKKNFNKILKLLPNAKIINSYSDLKNYLTLK